MITDDQVAELFAEANPIPDLEALDATVVLDDDNPESMSERSRRMVTVDLEKRRSPNSRRPLLVGALGAVVVAVIAVLLSLTGDRSDVAAPLDSEGEAIETAMDFFGAWTRGDVDEAMALMTPELADHEFNRSSVEFFAALPGTKTLSACNSVKGPSAVAVSCQTNFSGALMQATAPDTSTAIFSVEDGRLTTFTPGSQDAAAEAFVEYASQTRPLEYEQACSPESYEVASVRIHEQTGFALAGPCGELWAEVAEDAAAWVEAGKPSLTGDED